MYHEKARRFTLTGLVLTLALFLVACGPADQDQAAQPQAEASNQADQDFPFFHAPSLTGYSMDDLTQAFGEPDQVTPSESTNPQGQVATYTVIRYDGDQATQAFTFSDENDALISAQVWGRDKLFVSLPEKTPEALLEAFGISSGADMEWREENPLASDENLMMWEFFSISEDITDIVCLLPSDEAASGEAGFAVVTIYYSPYSSTSFLD